METVSLLSLLERNVHYKLIVKLSSIVVRFVRQKFPKILKFPTRLCCILTSLCPRRFHFRTHLFDHVLLTDKRSDGQQLAVVTDY